MFLCKVILTTLLGAVWVSGAAVDSQDGFYDPETDAIVIEAPTERDGRQFAWPQVPIAPFQMPARTPMHHSCYNSDGEAGHCATLKSCYPLYRLNANLPDWALGTKNTCKGTDATGRVSVYGVCCTSRQFGFGQQQQPGFGQGFFGQGGAINYPFVPGGGYPFQPGIQSPVGIQGQYPGQVQQPVQPPLHNPGVPAAPAPAPAPAPAQPAPAPVQPAPAPAQPNPNPPPAAAAPPAEDAVVTDTDTDNSGSEPPYDQCGVGRNYPIEYTEDGIEKEVYQRIHGEHELRVVNGWPAERNEWPWIAAMLNNGRQFCGGSLIDDRHILTAAHCVAHMTRNDVANLKIRLGEHNIKAPGEQIFETKVSRVVRHKGFSSETLHNDVALITLDTPVPSSYKSTIRPVCLPEGNERYEGKMGTVVGWGSLYEKGPQPSILQELSMEIWTNRECAKIYGSYAPGGITEHMMCAGQKGKDSCSGDSGGPFMVATGATYTQVGIVSWGIGCGKAQYPGVYTRTTNMRHWIDKVQRKF